MHNAFIHLGMTFALVAGADEALPPWAANAQTVPRMMAISFFGFFTISILAAETGASVLTTGTRLEEMTDLGRLVRWPEPAYRTIQFSSYDRRSASAEAPGWFSNEDGFGRELIAGFLKVLRGPRNAQAGLYLLADVSGPSVIVRGWLAGTGGVLRVCLAPAEDVDFCQIKVVSKANP